MLEINHRFSIQTEPEKLYEALTEQRHISKWWTVDCTVKPEEGSRAEFKWVAHGWRVVMRIEMLIPGQTVRWRCIESNMQNTAAWVGTDIRFEISRELNGKTKLSFLQAGYKQSPCYSECNAGWTFVLEKSLKGYLESGTGKPYGP